MAAFLKELEYVGILLSKHSAAKESTWDLVIFVGTGALGPLGSAQTVLLAVVNVLMQLVFVGIALFNFTEPEIDQDRNGMAEQILKI